MKNVMTTIGTCDFCSGQLEIVPYNTGEMIIRCSRCRMTYGKESVIKVGKIPNEVNLI